MGTYGKQNTYAIDRNDYLPKANFKKNNEELARGKKGGSWRWP